ncbi:MAG: SH3 domain-containing protein, partial [Firmicutes bacterium]|nr:SH3 domain-containing protein [Bacillota bacterium]
MGTKRFGDHIFCVRLAIVFLATLLFLSSACDLSASPVYAAEQAGFVSYAAGVYVRSGPGKGESVVGSLSYGDPVTVLGTSEDGLWYEIASAGGSGYVYAELITLSDGSEDPESDSYYEEGDFEAWLDYQGFPESYRDSLRYLHELHPSWRFIANYTGLDWSEVLYAETHPVSTNLVYINAPDAYKSGDPSAFDAETGYYIVYDSDAWVAASESAVAYYLDPRNSLGEESVFQFLSNRYGDSEESAEGLAAIVSGTFLDWGDPGDGYASYIDLLMETGAESGVSPLTLASMILVEQGPDGASDSVSGAYGYYNFFNINAYASGGLNAVQNGLIHAELQGWDTPAKSIKAGAAWYYRNFISCGQYTLYLKKFNVLNGLSSVGKGQYMTNVQGARAEGVRLSHGFMDAGSNALTFDIPVYYGMSDYPAPEPGSGDNIDFLSLLAIEDHELKPSFSPSRTEYSLTVPNETEAVTILAEPASPEAYVTGDGYAELAVGENDFTITCTSSTGESRSYTITIIRKAKKAQTEETEPGPETDPGSEEDAPASDTYDLSGTLLNYVLPETTAGELLAAIDSGEGSASIHNAAEEAIDADAR